MIHYLATKLIENKGGLTYYKGESIHRDLTLVHSDKEAWDELRDDMSKKGYMVYYNPSDDTYDVYQTD